MDQHIQPAAEALPQSAPFSFSGSGREYFGIWIVNLLLSIVTLGIYSAWAKVRRTKYFYNNTQVAGASFDYHGNPIAILKGRFVALMLIIMYQLAMRESGVVALLMLAAATFASPWLIWKSLQFKLYNSSYRGIRFGFRGTLGAVYKVYLLFPLLSGLTLFLLTPFAHQRLKKFQHEESRFGTTHFSFNASAGRFYKAYLVVFFVWLAGVIAITVLFGGSIGALSGLKNPAVRSAILAGLMTYLFALYVWLFVLFPIFSTLIQNLIWNHTQLGPHRFLCEMKWPRVVFIALTNILGVVCTLGLFTPFAQIRMMRYRIGSMTLLPEASLDEFVAAAQAEASATGEGVADLLDFDLSL
jgi:uncharacterized membrane protein YjgN (DUF898 family)